MPGAVRICHDFGAVQSSCAAYISACHKLAFVKCSWWRKCNVNMCRGLSTWECRLRRDLEWYYGVVAMLPPWMQRREEAAGKWLAEPNSKRRFRSGVFGLLRFLASVVRPCFALVLKATKNKRKNH